MPELRLSPVHALSKAPAGRFGASDTASPLVMTALPEDTVLQLLETAPSDIAELLANVGDFAVRPCAPAQWFAISDTPLSAETLSRLEAALAGKADIVDQSAGRIRIEIEGKNVRAALAKGVPVDLHPDVFEAGKSVTTLCGHLTVHLTRTGEDRFEILVTRSYALALWEALIEMSLEFGIACRV